MSAGSQPGGLQSPGLIAAEPQVYPLNPADRLVLLGQRALRSHNLPGWPIQTHWRLAGRVDVAKLRAALQRMNQLYPIATSRIVGKLSKAAWQTRPGAECILHETWLEDSSDDAVLRHAAEVLKWPVDLHACDPISFHLLHRPDGRDVFLFQYDHVLMDANAAIPLLKELDRLSETELAPGEPPRERVDEHAAYLARFTRWQRFRAVWNLIRRGIRYERLRAVVLEPPHDDLPADPTLRIRMLSEEQTKAVAAHSAKVTGVPSIAMSLLSAAFRAVSRLTRQPIEKRSVYSAPVGIKLRRVSAARELYCNLTALFNITIAPDDVTDRDRALKAAARSLQDQLAEQCDLGGIASCSLFRLDNKHLQKSAAAAARDGRKNTMRFGFFGSLHKAGDRFMGVEIELAYKTALAMPPWGLLLWANLSAGRLVISMVHHKPAISDELAEQFLDLVLQDLTSVSA